jgi:branched-chain amino acid transport system ATP-binding protein
MSDIVLKADNIVKVFGGLRAINDASLYLNKGEILGLIGPNGAGKTTMFNMISGVLPLTSGTITVHGKQIKKPKSFKMTAFGIGRTYQIVQPFMNLTVAENVMVGAFLNTRDSKVAKDEAMEVLEFLDLADKADMMGNNLTLMDLKRMEVARAMATKPSILLLDEVMAGLNPVGCEQVMEMIRVIHGTGISIVIIEHVMKAVMGLCERIYVLNHGKMIAEGTPSEISGNEAVIESYLGVRKHA